MTSEDRPPFCVGGDDSIRSVMRAIDRAAKGIALLVDDAGRLEAAITDGDIRRAILTGASLDASIQEVVRAKRDSPYPEPISATVGTDRSVLVTMMGEHHVRQIPLVDEDRRVVDLVTWDELLPKETLPLEAVVMAGGFGTRLQPLTESLPKPMLPVGDRPLLELIIEQLQTAGIGRVAITTHYLPEKITDHFGDGRKFGVDLQYVSEERPLGTAGALSMLKDPEQPLLVMNGDVLTGVDFRAMLAFHNEHSADLTVAVRQYDLDVPYGVLECDGVEVRRVRQKPTYSFFVNAGIYLLEPDVQRLIPPGEKFDMTDLIETLIAADRTVVSFPVVEYWLDVGQPADYERAQEDYRNGRLHS